MTAELWKVIPYIGSVFAFLAFLTAVVGAVFWQREAQKYKPLEGVTDPSARLELLLAILGSYRPKEDNLRIEDKVNALEIQFQHGLIRFKWMVGAGLILGVLLLVAVVLVALFAGASDKSNPALKPPFQDPLRVTGLSVRVGSSDKKMLLGELGKNWYDCTPEQFVQFDAALTRPGYAYMVVCRPDGKVDPVYPAEGQAPPLTDSPRYPAPEKRLNGYRLTDGTGLWVIAVVASPEPLLPYREWAATHPPAWTGTSAQSGTVWVDDGASLEVDSADGSTSPPRGDEQVLEPTAVAVTRVTDWLKQVAPGSTVRSIGFAVERSKP